MGFFNRIVSARRNFCERVYANPLSNDRLAFPAEGLPSKWYLHSLDSFNPEQDRFGFKLDAPHTKQREIVERLIQYFHRLDAEAKIQSFSDNKDMWLFISKSHEQFRAALAARDAERVSNMLLTAATGPLVAGFMNYEPFDRLSNKPEARFREAKHFVDKLLSLGESLGATPVQCIEQGVFGYESVDIDSLIATIGSLVEFDIAPPLAGGGSFGLKIDSNILCIKDLYAIYTSVRARSIVQDLPIKTVAEIGGGTGTLAYYLVKAGLPKVSVYDLPIVSVLQGYYLMRSLGPDEVWLHGEPHRDVVAHVQPYWTLREAPDKSIALVINQDSMPEIERSVAMEYLRLIRAKCRFFFLSINQEGQAPDQFMNPQSVVFNLVEEAGGFRRQCRFPHWMRATYVEELYHILD
jgi:putative sugar O-methyltransferase